MHGHFSCRQALLVGTHGAQLDTMMAPFILSIITSVHQTNLLLIILWQFVKALPVKAIATCMATKKYEME